MLKFAANISLLFAELPFIDRIAAAADMGFAAVEAQFPYGEDASALAKAAEESGIEFALINSPIGEESGRIGIACRPEFREAFQHSLSQARDYALALGGRKVNILAGAAAPEERNNCHELLVRNLAAAAAYFEGYGLTVLVEALNSHDRPSYFLSRTDEAVSVIEEVGASNLGFQFDVYHVAMMGLNVAEELMRLKPYIRHIQIADMPGRHEPGTGKLDFDAIFAAIERSGYDGWIGAEYVPSDSGRDSFDWYRAVTRKSEGLG